MPLPSDLLNETVRSLESHDESLRIKKVLFCLCKKYWENNLNLLNAFTFEDLIDELINSYSDIDSFKSALIKLVKTLNRPNVYTEVAKAIFDRLSKIYKQLEEEPQTAIVVRTDSSDLLDSVANNLENHQEQARIRKVIYSVCRRRWENDVRIVESYSLTSLLRELMQQYPTKDDLQKALVKLVQNINKQNLYLAIANIIVNQMGFLYNNVEEENSTQIVNTQFVQVNNHYNIVPNASEYDRLAPHDAAISVIDLNAQPVAELPPAQLEPAQPEQTQKSFNLFELRMEIMQYTNPLRAKVLLFSVLYQGWDKNNQDWAMLRSYTLDDLIKEAIVTAKSSSDIETKLFAASRVLTDFEANMQTAGIIVEAIKPYISN